MSSISEGIMTKPLLIFTMHQHKQLSKYWQCDFFYDSVSIIGKAHAENIILFKSLEHCPKFSL